MSDSASSTVTVELTPDQLELVKAALRLLLASEDDVEEIRAIKAMLAQLEPNAA